VAGHKNLVRLAASGPDAAAALLAVARSGKLPVQSLVASPAGAELVVPLDDVPDWAALRERAGAEVAGLTIDEDLGAVSAAGDFVGGDADLIDRARATAIGAEVPLSGIATSPLRLTLYCPAGSVDRLVELLHRILRESP
jgi:aspartokinase